jgi:hypothetical protein
MKTERNPGLRNGPESVIVRRVSGREGAGMELDRLYSLLKEEPRDVRWLMRKVGPDYRARVEDLREQGRPVEVVMQDVEGLSRAVYRAADQGELFSALVKSRRRRRRRRA